MKNLLAIGIAFSALISCKKEVKNPEIKTKSDCFPTAKKVDESVLKNNYGTLKEISQAEASDLLKVKQNDTLYITNFFATWCGPCMKEIPEFKAKMEELKGKAVKFTFISLDEKTDWNEAVKNFAEENNLTKNIVLLDGNSLPKDFFTKNFKTWNGESIPFTFMKKGDKTNETLGSMSKEGLQQKIKSFE